MPGLMPLLAVALIVAVAAWFLAWHHTRRITRPNPREEYRQLQRHASWLEQRLDQARRERWDPEMITTLSNQLGVACRQLNRLRNGIRDQTTTRVP
jgi:hypothetical protein